MDSRQASIHIDGAARGNPGPAAYAYVIQEHGRDDIEEATVLGSATNNIAEYTALVKVLQRAAKEGLRQLKIHSDSELMVKQMNGEYRVKNPELKALYDEAQEWLPSFEKVSIVHVRREQNKRADELCNIALDGGTKKHRKAAVPDKRATATSRAHVSDAKVREECLVCLQSALEAARRQGHHGPSAEQVWEQLWSILEEGGVLKKPKARTSE